MSPTTQVAGSAHCSPRVHPLDTRERDLLSRRRAERASAPAPTAGERPEAAEETGGAEEDVARGRHGLARLLRAPGRVDQERQAPLAEATSRLKTVPLDCDTLLTARDMGISFGDAMPLPDDPASWGVPSTHWEEIGAEP